MMQNKAPVSDRTEQAVTLLKDLWRASPDSELGKAMVRVLCELPDTDWQTLVRAHELRVHVIGDALAMEVRAHA